MRTTVTIDPDVYQLIQAAMQRSRRSFKETLNQALRRGLADMVPQWMSNRFGWMPAR